MLSMEVEDRHLNIIVDLINDMLINCQPLLYLSENFSPQDMVWRLSQLIIKYENNILSESQLITDLDYDINDNSLSACSAIRVWLLDYYKSDFVTLNEFKLENGVEEEIVLTALMVLRVLYQMRQIMDNKTNLVLTQGWSDLHEFDDALDEKFESRCLKLMSILVKHSVRYRLEIDQCLKQISCLKNDKTILEENFKLINRLPEKVVNKSPIRLNKTQIKKASNLTETINERQKSPNTSPRRSPQQNQKVETFPNQNQVIPKSALRSAQSPLKKAVKSLTFSPMSSPSNTPMSSPKRSPNKSNTTQKLITPNKTQSNANTMTRRSLRLSNSSPPKVNGNLDFTFNEIQAVFADTTDESEFEYFDNSPSTSTALKPISLPPKKRKHHFLQSPEKDNSINEKVIKSNRLKIQLKKQKITQPNKEKVDKSNRQSIIQLKSRKSGKSSCKTGKPHVWPSRNKVYPRKKRYPCDFPDCDYMADRPSTLVRHCRAHTGEKPYKCDWPGCDKRYKMSSNLTPHKLTHTGEKPYECDWPQCHKKFTYPQHLKRHRISHQKKSKRLRTEIARNIAESKKEIRVKREENNNNN